MNKTPRITSRAPPPGGPSARSARSRSPRASFVLPLVSGRRCLLASLPTAACGPLKVWSHWGRPVMIDDDDAFLAVLSSHAFLLINLSPTIFRFRQGWERLCIHVVSEGLALFFSFPSCTISTPHPQFPPHLSFPILLQISQGEMLPDTGSRHEGRFPQGQELFSLVYYKTIK